MCSAQGFGMQGVKQGSRAYWVTGSYPLKVTSELGCLRITRANLAKTAGDPRGRG